MNDNEALKLIYEEADKMRDRNVRFEITAYILMIFVEIIIGTIASLLLIWKTLTLIMGVMVVIHIARFRRAAREIRGNHIWRCNLIKNNLPDPNDAAEQPEWIRKMLHLYSKRLKYRPVNRDDSADFWKMN